MSLYDKVDRGLGLARVADARRRRRHRARRRRRRAVFSFDGGGPVDLLRASTSLYASDGFVVTSRPTADTHTATLSSMGGASGPFGRRPAAAADPPSPSRLELSFGDGARALSQYTDGDFSTAIALGDGCSSSCRRAGLSALRAATLKEGGRRRRRAAEGAGGDAAASRNEGGGAPGEPDARGATSDTYVRVALVGADGSAADDEAAQSETVPLTPRSPNGKGFPPAGELGTPPLLRVSVWDKDWAAGTDAPLAVADVTLAAEPSGTMSTVKLPARDELGEIDISFGMVATAPADAAVPPPSAAPAPREECASCRRAASPSAASPTVRSRPTLATATWATTR